MGSQYFPLVFLGRRVGVGSRTCGPVGVAGARDAPGHLAARLASSGRNFFEDAAIASRWGAHG